MNTSVKRTVVRLVAGVAAAATLMGTAACGSSSSSSGDSEMTFSYWDTFPVLKEFEKANPDFKLKEINVPGDSRSTR